MESNIKVKNENFEFPKKPNFKGSKCNLVIETSLITRASRVR